MCQHMSVCLCSYLSPVWVISRLQVSIWTSSPLFMLHISIYSCKCLFISDLAVANSNYRYRQTQNTLKVIERQAEGTRTISLPQFGQWYLDNPSRGTWKGTLCPLSPSLWTRLAVWDGVNKQRHFFFGRCLVAFSTWWKSIQLKWWLSVCFSHSLAIYSKTDEPTKTIKLYSIRPSVSVFILCLYYGYFLCACSKHLDGKTYQ